MFDQEKLTRIGEARDRWEETTLKPALARAPERSEQFQTDSGIPLERLFTPVDVGDCDYGRDLGFPGEYPFTRGPYPSMYRGRLWTMRLYSGFGTAEESNSRYRHLLEQGQTGLSVAFDLPTQIGYDADDPLAQGEVGRTGVSISSLEDMEILFAGIPLDKVSTSMTINAPAAVLLAMYQAVGEKQNVPPRALRGTIQNDILKEYVARGTYIYPPEPSMRLTADILVYCHEQMPKFNAISISGYHIREAGATAVQELAFTLANATAYVKAALARGLQVDDFAGQLSFFFNVHNNFFEEVAKFRAARRLWAKTMKELFGATNPGSMALRFHAQTGGSTLTAQQPLNNIVRVAIQALAAVLGGAQSLHTNSMDEALALPTEEAVEVALRTQQIIAHESGVTETIDPLAGSYFVEHLTDEIEKRARDLIERIELMGGALKAIGSGFVQREIEMSAYQYQREVDGGDKTIVGVNRFTTEAERRVKTVRVDETAQARQIERLRALRARRDGAQVKRTLNHLAEAARSIDNLMPPILAAVKAYATVGEICGVLREIFGEYRPLAGI
jgi:methylmalonyl-CoA mutase N-terminal domain/subunit